MSIACYRWLVDPHRRRDRLDYSHWGWPLPYLQTVAPPEAGQTRWDWTIERVEELGLEGFYFHALELGDRETAEAFKRSMDERDLTYCGGLALNLAAEEDEWRDTVYDYAAKQMQLNAWAGARIATLTHLEVARFNHFTADPPVAEQLRRATRNLATLLPLCEEHGIVMAWENHMDYRLRDIVAVVAEIDSPWLRITVDTGNPYLFMEDSLESATLAAKYTVAAHAKDLRLQPLTETYERQIFWAPVGQGDVPMEAIMDVLHRDAPDPDNLILCVETAPPPQIDPDPWVRSGIRWLRETIPTYLNPEKV
jgi:sugar phosphate isomerase/epimerase